MNIVGERIEWNRTTSVSHILFGCKWAKIALLGNYVGVGLQIGYDCKITWNWFWDCLTTELLFFSSSMKWI